MHNIHQVQIIRLAIQRQKDKYLSELAKVNFSMRKKMATINKMIEYQKDYFDPKNLVVSRETPALSKNFYAFASKIDGVISQAEMEMITLKNTQESILQTLSKITKKIELMKVFENRLLAEEIKRFDKLEQMTIDDLSSTMHLRGYHE